MIVWTPSVSIKFLQSLLRVVFCYAGFFKSCYNFFLNSDWISECTGSKNAFFAAPCFPSQESEQNFLPTGDVMFRKIFIMLFFYFIPSVASGLNGFFWTENLRENPIRIKLVDSL